MNQLVDLVEETPEDQFSGPGKGYLQGKLDAALFLLESEMAEFQDASTLEFLENILGGGYDEQG